MKKIKKKLVSLLIVLIIVVSDFTTIFAVNFDVMEIINGSPILSDAWDKDKFDSREIVALGVYMSNFIVPFVDNFDTAFQKGIDGIAYSKTGDNESYVQQYGSNGLGQTYLNLNVSEDRQEALADYFSRMIDQQVRGKSEKLYVTTDPKVPKNNSETDRHQATVDDLYKKNNDNIFYIENGTIILDFQDEEKYDNELFAIGLTKTAEKTGYQRYAQTITSNRSNYYLNYDILGNITTDTTDRKNVILFPACLNWNLFNIYQGNFLTQFTLHSITTKEVNVIGLSQVFGIDIPTGKFNIKDNDGGGKQFSSGNTKFTLNVEQDVEGFGSGFTLQDLLQYRARQNEGKKHKTAIKVWNDGRTVHNEPFKIFGESNSKGNYALNEQLIKSANDSGLTNFEIEQVYGKRFYLNYLFHMDEWNLNGAFQALKEKGETIIDAFDDITQITKEKKEEEVLNQSFLMLGSDEKMADKIIGTFTQFWVKLYENISGFTDRTDSTKVVGLDRFEDIFIVSGVVKVIRENIKEVAIFILVVALISAFIAGINGGLFLVLRRVVIFILVMLLLPPTFNFIVDRANGLLFSALQSDISYWCIRESVDYEGIQKDNSEVGNEEDSQYVLLMKELDFEGGRKLRYNQDMSPKLVDNTTDEIWDVLTSTVTGQMFLGEILRQVKVDDNTTAGVLLDLYSKWINVISLWDVQNGRIGLKIEDMNTFDGNMALQKTNGDGVKTDIMTTTEKQILYGGYKSTIGDEAWKSYSNRSDDYYNDNVLFNFGERYRGLLNVQERTHTNFYLMKDIGIEGVNDKFQKNQTVNASEVSSLKNSYDNTVSQLSNFSSFDTSPLRENNGYMYLTENVGAYFYSVLFDLWGGANKGDVVQTIMGKIDTDEEGNELKDLDGNTLMDSALKYKGQVIDFLDLEELFTNVIPYMYRVSLVAESSFEDEKIGEEFSIYKGNKKKWIYTANWVTKTLRVMGGDFGNVKVFSPAQYVWGGGNEKLCKTENRIMEFYNNLEPQIELLINYANQDGVTTNVLLRQIAVLSMLEFNKEFSNYRYKLEPSTIDVGALDVNTIFNQLLANAKSFNVNRSQSTARNLARNDKGIITLMIATILLCGLTPLSRIVILILFLIACISVLVYKMFKVNSTSDIVETVYGFLWSLIRLFIGHILLMIILMKLASVQESGLLVRANLLQTILTFNRSGGDFGIWIRFAYVIILCILEIIWYWITFVKTTGIGVGEDGKFHFFDKDKILTLGGHQALEKCNNTAQSIYNKVGVPIAERWSAFTYREKKGGASEKQMEDAQNKENYTKKENKQYQNSLNNSDVDKAVRESEETKQAKEEIIQIMTKINNEEAKKMKEEADKKMKR